MTVATKALKNLYDGEYLLCFYEIDLKFIKSDLENVEAKPRVWFYHIVYSIYEKIVRKLSIETESTNTKKKHPYKTHSLLRIDTKTFVLFYY